MGDGISQEYGVRLMQKLGHANEQKLIQLRSGLDVAIALAEVVCADWHHHSATKVNDREGLLNMLRDIRTELREMIEVR